MIITLMLCILSNENFIIAHPLYHRSHIEQKAGVAGTVGIGSNRLQAMFARWTEF